MVCLSVIPMKLLTIAGPLDQFDTVVRECVINQEFHPENTLQTMKDVKGLRPFELNNPYTALLRRAEQVADEAGIPLEYEPFDSALGDDPASFADYFDTLEKRVNDLTQKREDLLQEAKNCRNLALQLEKLKGVAVNLEDLWDLDFSRFRFGYLPRETYDSFQQALNGDDNILFFPTSIEPKLVYGVYFTTKAAHEKVDALFNSLHFIRLHIDTHAHGSAGQAIIELTAEAEAAEKAAEQAKQDIFGLKPAEHDRLLADYCYLRYMNDAYDMRRFAAHSRETFYLMGWVPSDKLAEIEAKLSKFDRLSCVVDNAGDIPDMTPPTKLKNSFLGRVFQPFLEMYGLPAYNEIDPSVFMAITYCLFFGIMFGDLGQGLCLALIGFVLSKWKKMWLGNIITCCGLSGAVFGCIYGSVFGMEEILPGFKIMEESVLSGMGEVSNVLLLLVMSIILGVIMLAFVMVLNIINGIRQHNFEKILFGPNGVAGMVFYLGLIGAAVSTLLFGVNLFVPAYILPVIVLPLLLILFKEPLSLMLEGNPEWKEIKIGGLIVTGFFELFETCLSFLTNTLSFMRVGAYAITHVGLMLVVQMLANMAGGLASPGGIIVMILGNLFVMGFEGLLVGIQVVRLEFYELFGRFYDDGGVAYEPKIIDYTSRSAA